MSRICQVVLFSLSLTLVSFFAASDAAACSCVPASAKLYLNGADSVYVAKSLRYRVSKNVTTQEFRVLDTLKGRSRRNFKTKWMLSPCPPELGKKKGQGALLFVSRGQLLSMCSGNFYLEAHRGILFDLLRGVGAKKSFVTSAEKQKIAAAVAAHPAGSSGSIAIEESLRHGRTTVAQGKTSDGKTFAVLLVTIEALRRRRKSKGRLGVHQRYRYPEIVHTWVSR